MNAINLPVHLRDTREDAEHAIRSPSDAGLDMKSLSLGVSRYVRPIHGTTAEAAQARALLSHSAVAATSAHA